MRYFRGSFFVTAVGLLAGAAIGWEITRTFQGMLTTVFIVAVLAILEVSLSFDNAVVNATVVAQMSPISALVLAATDPDEYSRILTSAHVSVSAFGGAFLAMVGLKHFFDIEKEVYWIAVIERPLARLGRIEAVELGFVMILLWLV